MEWFRHDANALRNRKIRKAIRSHGPVAYAIYFALLESIYQEEGDFQILADELWLEGLADDLKITDYRVLIRVLDTFSAIGLIDSQLWQGEHIIYISAIAERGDAYLAKRQKESEKKRKQRAKKKAESNLSPGDNERTKGRTPKMSPADPEYLNTQECLNTSSEPDPEVFKDPGLNKNAIANARAQEKTSTARGTPTDVLAAQFTIKPWRVDGRLPDAFCKFVGSQISFDGEKDPMHPKTKGRNHILNLERAGELEKLHGYWQDFGEQDARAAPVNYVALPPEIDRERAFRAVRTIA